ncbi:FabD/lysophospholipase-like protein, partial [Lizonia empirigonia]
MLASYPPGAHSKYRLPKIPKDVYYSTPPLIAAGFAPETLFQELYLAPCRAAISAYSADEQIHDQFLRLVLKEFNETFARQLRSTTSTAHLHRQTLQKHHKQLAPFKSHRSCFCCFVQMPEKVVACGHALCDSCVKIYGVRSRTEKNSYKLSECPICGIDHQEVVFRFVPPTAGIRRLSVDGGGVKGIIPLVFLQHIDTLLKPLGLPVQDYFDMVCGTSAGGLVVIGLFLLRWSVREAIQRFEDVAQKTFGRRATLLARALQLLVAYVRDGQYSLVAIQEAFQKTLNCPLQMFNPLRNDTKVAVTTTTVKDSTALLFTNYNAGKRPLGLDYDIVRAEHARDDISVGEAACCTSAAPLQPYAVGKIGLCQDGGLLHNCPSDIAQWETRFVWPNKPSEPDFALSL